VTPAGARPGRSDLVLAAVAVVAGVLFFSHLGDLWPLAHFDVTADRGAIEATARRGLAERGLDVAGFRSACRLVVDRRALDYLDRTFGRERTQELIAAGLPVYSDEVHFKRRGDPDRLWAVVDPAHGLTGWGRTLQEDAPGPTLTTDEARALVHLPPGQWKPRGAAEEAHPERVDHQFVYERQVSERPELRERLTVIVGGDRVTTVDRSVVVPDAARRAERVRRAPVAALQAFGFLALGVAVVIAFAVFLTRLRAGVARLGPPVVWASLVGVCFVATQALQGASLLLAWDPLWPRWVSTLQVLGIAAAEGGVITLFLLVVISAGDALDRFPSPGRIPGGAPGRIPGGIPGGIQSGLPAGPAGSARRGASLWLAGRGRLADPAVGLASARGFLVGVCCGGVMTATLLALQTFAGARVPIQPQGFFFFALNSDVPALSTLLYFLMVALAEELGYRFFAGSWLLATFRGRRFAALAAVVVPAVIYGTTHTGLTFLPPEDPFWGRALVFTLVGCVWGWAFLRYDALTVVLSHWTADLFIFNWPRLASGEPALVATAVATIAVPLVPAALWLMRSLARRGPLAAGPPAR